MGKHQLDIPWFYGPGDTIANPTNWEPTVPGRFLRNRVIPKVQQTVQPKVQPKVKQTIQKKKKKVVLKDDEIVQILLEIRLHIMPEQKD